MSAKIQLFISLILLIISPFSLANNDLPEIGTAGAGALTIEKEKQYGWAFRMMANQALPIVRDPVLNNYIDNLGNNIVGHADSVKMPFTFYLVQDNEINAAAFLGGNVKINTGLFLYAKTESELASVVAHEVAHITQRHLARMLEQQALTNPTSMAALAGSILLTLVSPAAGVAAISTTIALNAQSQINYTRLHEYEADRIGIQTLAAAGYDPFGMADFFGKLAEKYKYASTPPQMLLTHPLPETRLSEARLRAAQYPKKQIQSSLDYQLSKVRITVRFSNSNPEVLVNRYQNQLKNNRYQIKQAAQYGLALAYFQLQNYKKAYEINQELIKADQFNLFYIDLAADIALATGQAKAAIKALKEYEQHYPNNQVIMFNLVAALKEKKQYQPAEKRLEFFLRSHPENILAHQIAIELYALMGEKAKEHATRAEYLALLGRFREASQQMGTALAYTTNKLDQARYSAKIEQFRGEDIRLQELQD